MSDSRHIQTETLRIVACATCGVSYALPLPAYLVAAQDRLPIYCPRGHAWMPLPPNADPALNLGFASK